MADPRHEGLDLIFWKKQVPSEEQIKAIEGKGIGLSPRDRNAVADDTKKGIDALQKAADQEAFIATFPPELHDVLRRIAPKPKGVIKTPPPSVGASSSADPQPSGDPVANNNQHGDRPQGDRPQQGEQNRNKNKGGQQADAAALAMVARAEEERKAAEALALKAIAEANAKKAEDDRKTAEAQARQAETNRLAKEDERRATEREASRIRIEETEKAGIRPDRGVRPPPATSSTPAASVTPPTPPAAEERKGRSITIDASSLGWILLAVVLAFMAYHTLGWGVHQPIVEPQVSPAQMPARLSEDEAKIRAMCVRLRYATTPDAPRCTELYNGFLKSKGIDPTSLPSQPTAAPAPADPGGPRIIPHP